MGAFFSCPLGLYYDLENGFESIKHKDDWPIPFTGKDSESESPALQSLDSGEGSVGKNHNMGLSAETIVEPIPSSTTRSLKENLANPSSPKHEAATKLQKVYKSFRTRRKLADCAVVIEQSWWKLLDFAELKHSSISFFDIEKHESAISRWSRARARAAKVGKGLSKNSKAQKLALQHWLEAIDPRHRYGHNLHFYYVKWLNSQGKEPFFYWLDIGEGKEINLTEKCPRSKLQQQCIKYLGPIERKNYEVGVENGKLFYREAGQLLDTIDEPKGCKWIFVLSTSKTLYVGKKTKGSFQHSSFLAGGATLAAGRIVAEEGVLKAVWPHSGHYRPTPENFQDLLSFLRENNVDLTDVKLDSIDDDEQSVGKHVRNHSSEDDLMVKDQLETEENNSEHTISNKFDMGAAVIQMPKFRTPRDFTKLTTLEIPSNDDLVEKLKIEEVAAEHENNMSVETKEEETIPEDLIFQRIDSHKGTKSFQLGKQLSCKWSTGAGPRIGCVRDYPYGLQSHALEQVNLSPSNKSRLRFHFPSRALTPNSSHLSRSLGGSCHL